MKAAMNARRWMLLTGLAATLAATAWLAGSSEDDAVPGAARGSATARRPAGALRAAAVPPLELQLDRLRRPAFTDKAGTAFSGAKLAAASAAAAGGQPAAAEAPLPPAPPQAPPLPFSYYGESSPTASAWCSWRRARAIIPWPRATA